MDREVLVLAEAGEVERLAVDEEAVAVDGDRAHAERLRVGIDDLAAIVMSGDAGLTLTAYSAEPGTPEHDALILLASWAATSSDEAHQDASRP